MVGIYPASGFPSQARNPTHFTSHGLVKYMTKFEFRQEPPTRFELATSGLQNRCSTTELQRQAPPTRFELVTNRLTVDSSTAELQGNTNGGVATPLFYFELTKLLILSASASTASYVGNSG